MTKRIAPSSHNSAKATLALATNNALPPASVVVNEALETVQPTPRPSARVVKRVEEDEGVVSDAPWAIEEDTQEPLAQADSTAWVNGQGESLQLAQASRGDDSSAVASDAPSSVGEELFRQSTPLNTPSSGPLADLWGFIPQGWGWPLALGGGVVAITALSSSSSSPASSPPSTGPAAEPDPTYTISVTPMVGTFSNGNHVKLAIYKNGALWTAWNADAIQLVDGKMTLNKIALSELKVGDILRLELSDNNGSSFNYDDPTIDTNRANRSSNTDLGSNTLRAWVTVPSSLSSTSPTLELAVTPLTELAHRAMGQPDHTGKPDAQAILTANNAVAKAFGLQEVGGANVDLVLTPPAATNTNAYESASAASQAYGRAIALLSSLANASQDDASSRSAVGLREALNVLTRDGDFVLNPEQMVKLNQALLAYNEKTTVSAKLPGISLNETKGLLGEVALLNYDDGLAFTVYAPREAKVGDVITLTFQAFTANGTLDSSKSFQFLHTLVNDPAGKNYQGDPVNIPRLVKDPNNESVLNPYTDKDGQTLSGIGQADADDGFYHYRVTSEDVKGLVAYQDFALNLSPITITRASITQTSPAYFKNGDKALVTVLLDEPINWNIGSGSTPLVLTIQYTKLDGTKGELTAKIDSTLSDGTPLPKPGNTLNFTFEFQDIEAIGPLTIDKNALTGDAWNSAGTPLTADYWKKVNTEVTNSGWTIDTLPPSPVKLEVDAMTKVNPSEVGGEVVNFINTDKPMLKVLFTDTDGNNPTATFPEKGDESITVQLFAYRSDQGRNDAGLLIAEVVVKRGETAVFKEDSYKPDWSSSRVVKDMDGQQYRFFARAIDAAGNEGLVIKEDLDLSLWIDTQPPAAPSLSYEPSTAADNTDPVPTDPITNTTKPNFTVTAEPGSVAKLYLLNENGSKTELASATLPGALGTANTVVTLSPTNALPEGKHRFVTSVTDKAGNPSPDSAPVEVEVKTTPPSSGTLAIVNPPASGFYVAGDVIEFALTFEEAVYLSPVEEGKPARPYITFNTGAEVGGAGQLATLSGGLGTKTLIFSYTVPSDKTSLDTPLGQTISIAESTQLYQPVTLVDIAGNKLPASTVLTPNGPSNPLAIDTVKPPAPTLALGPGLDGEASTAELLATTGVVTVTAEAGSKVDVTFTVGTGADAKTVVKTIASATGTSANAVVLTADDLATLGISATNNASMSVTDRATDPAGNVSDAADLASALVVDTLAPSIKTAGVATGTAAVIGRSDPTTIETVDFLVTFSEALLTPPSKSDFTTMDGLGVVNSVTAVEGQANAFRINVTPVDQKTGDLILSFQGSPLQDAAGNALDAQGLSAAKQAFDTRAPTVSLVADNITSDVANGSANIVFTVTFGEPTFFRGTNLKNSFSATNGTVESAAVVETSGSAAGGYTQYTVTIKPNLNVASGSVTLSLKPSGSGGIVDLYNNAAILQGSAPIDLTDKGGSQAFDTVKPDAPVLAVGSGSGLDGEASTAELLATTGVVTVTAEAGSKVDVTFTVGTGADAKTVVKTIASATGTSANAVVLTADDLATLGISATNNASMSVTARATDPAGNVSDAGGLASALVVDTLAPTVTSTTDNVVGDVAGPAHVTFKVTFDEALLTQPTPSNFALTDGSMGTIESVSREVTTNAYTVVVKPALGKTGQLQLKLVGTGLTDAAGNTVMDAPLAQVQAINTVAPKVVLVTDNAAAEVINSNTNLTYTVTFDKALDPALNAETLKSGFIDANGEVLNVTRVSGTAYTVTVKPTLGLANAKMSLSVVAGKLTDALGNVVSAGSLESFNAQEIDTLAPSAPNITLSKASDTGLSDSDSVTSVTHPSFDLAGLDVGNTVDVFLDADGSGSFNTGDTLLFRGPATAAGMSITLADPLSDGTYTNLRATQTDPNGNVSPSVRLGGLTIQSAPPQALASLVFDAVEDTTNTLGQDLGLGNRNYITDRPAPTFNFTGGTDGSTAVLFLDKNKNGLLDAGEELGRSTIETNNRFVVVDPLNGLANGTYGPSSALGVIRVLEINAAGVTGPSTALQLLNVPLDDGSVRTFTGLTIQAGPPQAVVLSSTEISQITNDKLLTFSVTGGQLGGSITVTADATDASGVTTNGVVVGSVASPNGTGNVDIDVSTLATAGAITYKNFQAFQTYAGQKGTPSVVSFTDPAVATAGITLDHALPTVQSLVSDKTTLLLDEQATLTITFSEKISGLTADEFDGLGGGTVSGISTNDEGTTWTATYKPAADSKSVLALSVKASATTDTAGNASVASTALALNVNTKAQVAPTQVVPAQIDDVWVVGEARSLSGITVSDVNDNLAQVVLSVNNGTLSIAATDGVDIVGNGAASLTLTSTLSGHDATVALNAALAKLFMTPSNTNAATLTVISTDTVVGATPAASTTNTVSIPNISAAPAAPENTVPAALTTTEAAFVVGQAFELNDVNALKVNDVNHDISKVEVSVGNGVLSMLATDGITIQGNGTASLNLSTTLTGTAATAAFNAALAQLTYTANGTLATTDTLTLKTTDVGGRADTDTLALTVNAAPVAPINTVPAAGPDGILTNIATSIEGLSVGDADSNLASVALTVLSGSLNMAATEGVTLAGAGTASLTLSTTLTGTAATAAFNAALAKLTYTANASTTTDTLSITTTDRTAANLGGPKIDTDTLNLVVNAAPLAPVNTLPAPPGGVITGQAFDMKGVSVADGDNNLVSVQLSVLNGALTLIAPSDVTITNNGTPSVTLTSTLSGAEATAAFNNALATLRYQSNAGYAGADTLTMISLDSTGEVLGGARTDNDALHFTVYAEPLAPVNTLPTSITGVLVGQEVAMGPISVADPDDNLASVVLSVSHGTLKLNVSEGVVLSGNNSDTVTLTGTSAAQLNAVLATLTYTSNAGYIGSDTLKVLTTDSTGAALGGVKSSESTRDFTVLAAPENTVPGAWEGAVGGQLLALSGLSVADADDSVSQVVLTVSHGELSSTSPSGVTVSDSGKTLTLTGNPVALNAALAQVSYTLSSPMGQHGVTLTMTSTDSDGLMDTDTVSFDVAQAANVAPEGSAHIVSSTGAFGVGAELSVDLAGVIDGNGLGAFSYVWSRTIDGATTAIIGANQATYTLVGADAGATLSVKMSYIDGAGHSETLSAQADAAITWPDSLSLGSASLRFYDDPSTPAQPAVLQTSGSAKFMALQKNSYYVLDVDGSGTIDTVDKTTFASELLGSNGVFTTSSGIQLKLLSVDEWGVLNGLFGEAGLPAEWFGATDAADKATYWTRTPDAEPGAHLVYMPSTQAREAVADDATPFNPLAAYYYHVFQVI